MIKFAGLLMSLLMMGVAYAQDEGGAAAEVVLPEPNYIGIALFLLISVGSCVWFFVKVMKSKDDDEK